MIELSLSARFFRKTAAFSTEVLMKMNLISLCPLVLLPLVSFVHAMGDEDVWWVGSQEEWKKAIESSEGVAVEDGEVLPTGESGSFKTVIKSYDEKQSASVLLLEAVSHLAELD